jgi:hypothetical protein
MVLQVAAGDIGQLTDFDGDAGSAGRVDRLTIWASSPRSGGTSVRGGTGPPQDQTSDAPPPSRGAVRTASGRRALLLAGSQVSHGDRAYAMPVPATRISTTPAHGTMISETRPSRAFRVTSSICELGIVSVRWLGPRISPFHWAWTGAVLLRPVLVAAGRSPCGGEFPVPAGGMRGTGLLQIQDRLTPVVQRLGICGSRSWTTGWNQDGSRERSVNAGRTGPHSRSPVRSRPLASFMARSRQA